MTLKEILKRIGDSFRQCLSCQKNLTDRDLRKKMSRCKKCYRQYKKIWYESNQEYQKIFQEAE